MLNQEAELGGEVLTVPQTAEILQVHPQMVYDLITRGELHPLRVGRLIRLTRAELQRWMSEKVGAEG